MPGEETAKSTGRQIAGLEATMEQTAAETDQALLELSQQAQEGVEDLRRAVRALSAEVRWQRQALNTLIKIMKSFFGFISKS